MILSLVKAAEVSGKSKSTINRAIKSGKLSAHRNEDGSYDIDPSELARVFPTKGSDTSSKEPNEKHMEPHKIQILEAQLDAAHERLKVASDRLMEKDEIITDLKSDRDSWRQQANRILENHKEGDDKKTSGFWKRLLG